MPVWIMNNALEILSAVLSIVAIVVSILTAHSQKRFEEQNSRPILEFDFVDLEDRLCVKLKNNGIGPAIIYDSIFYGKSHEINKKLLVDAVDKVLEEERPDRKLWKRYLETVDTTIGPNEVCYLIEIVSQDTDLLDELRDVLAEMEVKVFYKDIHGNQLKPLERDFSYFGRKNECTYSL